MLSKYAEVLSSCQQLLMDVPLAQDLLLFLLEQPADCDRLKHNCPDIEFIGLVGFDPKRQKLVFVEIQNGPKNPDKNHGLSEREQQVVQLVAKGYTNFQIAQKLAIAENTVKTHLQNIFAKLKVQSRTEAAIYATQWDWMRG